MSCALTMVRAMQVRRERPMKNAKIRRFETVDTAETEITPKQLTAMRNVDVRTVDKSTLVDIADVEIDMALPDRERIRDFIRQIKNPYCYLDHGIVVKVSFAGKRSMEESIVHYINTMEG